MSGLLSITEKCVVSIDIKIYVVNEQFQFELMCYTKAKIILILQIIDYRLKQDSKELKTGRKTLTLTNTDIYDYTNQTFLPVTLVE